MDRFVALLWDSAIESRTRQVEAWSQALRRQSGKWATVLDLPGLRVHSYHHRGDGPVVTAWPERNGLIIGPLFRRGDEHKGRVKQFSGVDAERIAASDGDALIRDWWGNYVAIWRPRGDDGAVVIRDPCGAVPCFMTAQQDVQILFAHAEDVAALSGIEFTIDWTYVQAFLHLNFFVTKYTGLREVIELLPGERLRFHAREPNQLSWAWNAVTLAATPHDQRFKDATEELRATAESCFSAWGQEYRKILVSVSGGLDSSILLNLMRRVCDAEITAVHYRGFAYEDYETELARAAARHADVECLDLQRPVSAAALPRLLNDPIVSRPHVRMFATEIDTLTDNIANSRDMDAFFIGQGGDHIFLQYGAAKHTTTDYIYARGPSPKFLSVAYHAASLRRRSASTIAHETLIALLSPKGANQLSELQAVLKVEDPPFSLNALDALPTDYKLHPWLDQARNLPPGKASHLGHLVSLYKYHVRHGRALRRDVCMPYISQPLFEFALKTPIYTLAEQGVDRALQRAAFADLIPHAIYRRIAKGGANRYSMLFMQRNMDFMRNLIRKGHLIESGWFDQRKLLQMLTDEFPAHGRGSMFLKHLTIAEIWLHNCLAAGARAHT